MKKQRKQFLVLIVVVAVLAGVYFGVRNYNEKQTAAQAEAEREETIILVDAQEAEIAGFDFVSGGETLLFEREGDAWTYPADAAADIDEDVVSDMLTNLCGLAADEKLDNPEDAGGYGFDAPTNVISYTTESGAKTLTIGMENPITGQYYVKTSDSDEIYLIASTLVTSFDKTLDDMIKQEETSGEAITQAQEETSGQAVQTITEEQETTSGRAVQTITEEQGATSGQAVQTITEEQGATSGQAVQTITESQETTSGRAVQTITEEQGATSEQAVTGGQEVTSEQVVIEAQEATSE